MNERRKDLPMSPTERRERRVAAAVGIGVVAATALLIFLVRPRTPSTAVPTTTTSGIVTSTSAPTTSTTSPTPSSTSTP